MVRKILFLLGLVAVILIVFLFRNTFNVQESVKYDLSGRIKEVKDSSIIFEGTVSLNGKTENRTIEFVFNNRTDFKKMAIVITKEQAMSGKPFEPKTVITTGAFSDLNTGTRIFDVQSKGDLFTKDKVQINGIYYLIYEYDSPLPQ